jgi:hypothetical protein
MARSADLAHRAGVQFVYRGYLSTAADPHNPLVPLTGLSAVASFDGGAPTGTGVSVEADPYGVPGHFQLTITAAALSGVSRCTATVSGSGAEDFTVNLRCGVGKELAYGIPSGPEDAAGAERCEETGLFAPASRLKTVAGREGKITRVADFVDFRPEN